MCLLVAQSCPILCNPMDCSPPGSSVHRILQAGILERVAIAFSRESSQTGDWTRVSCIAGRFFIVWAYLHVTVLSSVQFISLAQSCPTLCDPMNHSTPGLPVHHQLLESTQTHVHCVGDAIQPSHPLLSPSFLPLMFLSIRVFSNESVLHIRWLKYWSFSFNISPSNEYSGLISFMMDWFDLFAVQGTLESSPTP